MFNGITDKSVSLVTVNKAQQLLQGLQATGNEDTQLSSVIEMCQVCLFFSVRLLSVLRGHSRFSSLPQRPMKKVTFKVKELQESDEGHHKCLPCWYYIF